MNRNSKFIVPILTWIVISSSLFLSIFQKLNQPIDFKIASRYLLVGFIGFVFSYLLRRFKLYQGSNLFLILSFISGVYLYVGMPLNPEGFQELGVLLTWLLLMGGSLLATLIYELIRYYIKK